MATMSLLQIILSAILLIASVVLTAIVLMQPGKSNYLGGAIAGGAAESFMDKKSVRSFDKTLAKITKYIAIIFIVLTLALNIVIFLFK